MAFQFALAAAARNAIRGVLGGVARRTAGRLGRIAPGSRNRVYLEVDNADVLYNLSQLPEDILEDVARDIVTEAADRFVLPEARRRVPVKTAKLFRTGRRKAPMRGDDRTSVWVDIFFGWPHLREDTYGAIQELGAPNWKGEAQRYLRGALYDNEDRINYHAGWVIARYLRRYRPKKAPTAFASKVMGKVSDWRVR